MKTKMKNIKTEGALPKEMLRDIHIQFKNSKPLTEEQLEKLCRITDISNLWGITAWTKFANATGKRV